MAELTKVGDLTVVVERPHVSTTKPRVLLIHGMFGGAWYWESYQQLLLLQGYESHAINLRGHHGSRPVADIGSVSLADYIDDAAEAARPLDRPIVIGHSMGGLIAQKLAETGASRATVLLASAPPRWIVPVSWLLLRKQIKYLAPLLTRQALVPDRSDADALMFNRTPVADRAAFFARLVPESGRAGLELSIGSVAIREQRVTSPMLVVGAADDRFVVPRVARALARKYRATFRSYEGHAHHLMCEPGWERPASEIIQWMETSK